MTDARTYQKPDSTALQHFLMRQSQQDNQWLQQEVSKRMAERLDMIRLQPTHIQEWWPNFNGQTTDWKQFYPQASVTNVHHDMFGAEKTQGFHQSWWKKIWGRSKASVAADLVQSSSDRQPADLLWANMLLHWMDPQLLFKQWQAAMNVGGFLMFSCLGPDTLMELRQLYDRKGWGHATPDFLDMHDLGDLLSHSGLTDPVLDMEKIHLTWTSAESLLKDLQAWGINAHTMRFQGLRGKQWKKDLLAALEELRPAANEPLTLTFEVLYGHAIRTSPKVKVESESQISLRDMKQMLQKKR